MSHVSQAHAAYLDATRRLLMEHMVDSTLSRFAAQQQQQTKPFQQQPIAQPAQQPQQKEPMATELEGLAEMFKSELASSLAQLVDSTLSRFAAQQQQQRRNVIVNNSSSKSSADESELSKLQRGRVIDRGLRNGDFYNRPKLQSPFAVAAQPTTAAATIRPSTPVASSEPLLQLLGLFRGGRRSSGRLFLAAEQVPSTSSVLQAPPTPQKK